ncbi:STAS domain-containing protein [Streptomyces cyaneofuscatus]|uniref:STAS domain-containing protein n=1 Tax=Streptomyces cyaneofuscatus TaxID=66883 RepID=UPI003F4C3D74
MWNSTARVRVREVAGVLVVQADGEFDLDEVDLLLAAWEEADELALPATVLDLTGCVFGDSSFLGALLIGRSRHLASGRRLTLAGPLQPGILLLLAVSGTLHAFDLAESLAEAIAGEPAAPA